MNSPPHFKRAATLPYDLSLITIHVPGCHYFYQTLMFHSVVSLHFYNVAEYFIMALLQIYWWICRCKNFQDRLAFGEVTDETLVSWIFWLTVAMHYGCLLRLSPFINCSSTCQGTRCRRRQVRNKLLNSSCTGCGGSNHRCGHTCSSNRSCGLNSTYYRFRTNNCKRLRNRRRWWR